MYVGHCFRKRHIGVVKYAAHLWCCPARPTFRGIEYEEFCMPEKIEELVRAALAAAQEAGELPAFDLEDCGLERPADTSHGEWTSTR